MSSQPRKSKAASSKRQPKNKQRTMPKIHDVGEDVVVEHKEKIGVVYGSELFQVRSFRINPGTLFPYLGQMAKLFDQYRFTKFEVLAETAASDFCVGSMMIGPEYDPSDPDPIDSETFSAYEGVKRFNPKESRVIPFNVTKMTTPGPYKFVRTNMLPLDELTEHDSGKIVVANYGQATGAGLGSVVTELYVRYAIRFRGQQVNAPNPGLPVRSEWILTDVSTGTVADNSDTVVQFGSSGGVSQVLGDGNTGITVFPGLDSPSDNLWTSILFPPNAYKVTQTTEFHVQLSTGPGLPSYANALQQNFVHCMENGLIPSDPNDWEQPSKFANNNCTLLTTKIDSPDYDVTTSMYTWQIISVFLVSVNGRDHPNGLQFSPVFVVGAAEYPPVLLQDFTFEAQTEICVELA